MLTAVAAEALCTLAESRQRVCGLHYFDISRVCTARVAGWLVRIGKDEVVLYLRHAYTWSPVPVMPNRTIQLHKPDALDLTLGPPGQLCVCCVFSAVRCRYRERI